MKLSIKHKMLYSLIIIFFIMYIITTLVIGKTIQKNNQVIIDKEMKNYVYNLSLYLKQYIKTNGIDTTPEAFRNSVSDIGTILSNKYDERITLYSPDGELLFDSIYKEGELSDGIDKKEDLYTAISDNNSAYSIINADNRKLVTLSLVVISNDKTLGIVRYFFDYTYLFNISENIYSYISIAIIIIFFFLFIFIYLLSRKITKPIIQLNEATKMVAQGNFDYNIKYNRYNRKDEIEELAYNFNLMKDKIKEQLEEIKTDRDNLVRLHKHRKLFFDNVTHEMKTPLTIISGYTQILQEHELTDKAFVQRTLNNIKNEANRLHAMILELLDAAKAESDMEYKFMELNISEIIKDINEKMRIRASVKNIEVLESIEEGVEILGDQLRMGQVLVNLLDNAIKYSNHNTFIKVKLHTDSHNCCIAIQDEGVGISHYNIENLFKPFYRVNKQMKESSGLGLYIVKVIIERHHGSIYIDSVEGKGTKVCLKIPLKNLQDV